MPARSCLREGSDSQFRGRTHICEMDVRGVLVYCADYQCSHSILVIADLFARDPESLTSLTRTISAIIAKYREARQQFRPEKDQRGRAEDHQPRRSGS
jgi:hypothetical protein